MESDYVFTGDKGQRMNEDALAGAFKRLCEKLGLRTIRLHDLRHGASSLLADTGTKPHETQAILGRSHVDTSMWVYTHAALQAQREAFDRVGALLGADEPVADSAERFPSSAGRGSAQLTVKMLVLGVELGS
ncbi:tyrosine-type recombinase/integrase [Streptomyces pinistramenti]|uniref:tyrosine-type recombinase/integrase n=1 Tax=Streptomyces pinistramenti TaxID=2884812 RepID=UPI001D072E50|nr:tyrosine-type recombinase/integrase [Streptomyces pinistramenti]MCB5905922.1 tyrosine-type recombinase/integrase [Streptomyces pinistramenti]